MPAKALFDSCEDCMGSGGQRDYYGEGSCGTCGGSGRIPANAAARARVRSMERARTQMFERMAERDYDRE